MSNPSIQFRGPYAWTWSAMAVLLLAWCMWAPAFVARSVFLLGLRAWYTGFMPLELFGTWRNAVHDGRGDPEQIRTLSQLLQRVGEIAKDNSYAAWWKGWSMLVTGYVVLLGVTAGLAFWPVGPFLGRLSVTGALFALVVFFWNLYHQLRRYRYG